MTKQKAIERIEAELAAVRVRFETAYERSGEASLHVSNLCGKLQALDFTLRILRGGSK